MAAQFEVSLSDRLLDELTRTYVIVSGRDTKELLKLTTKYCKGMNIPISAEAFRRCAYFRGLANTSKPNPSMVQVLTA